MIPLIVRDRTDNHICDIYVGNLPCVADTYKKGTLSRLAAGRNNVLGVRGSWSETALHSGVQPHAIHQTETG